MRLKGNAMVPLLVLLAVHRPFDGEDAIHAARAFLYRMKVRDLGGVRTVKQRKGDDLGESEGKKWDVDFDLPNDDHFLVTVLQGGTVVYARRPSVPINFLMPKDSPASRRLSMEFMHRVPHPIAVRPHRPAPSPYEGGGFTAVVNGLTFFNRNIDYGYVFAYTDAGELYYFGANIHLPPVASPKPSINRDQATSRLGAFWDIAPHQAPYPQHVEAELGYYLVKGEVTARLVWRGHVVRDEHFPLEWREYLKDYVDAVTGEAVRANPGD